MHRAMQRRRAHWADIRAADAAKEEERRRAEAAWAEHLAMLEAIEAERNAAPAPAPRVRSL